MAKYYYTNMISALATGQISYRDAMCEILKRLCDLENDKVQNQADWTETDSTSPSYIQHKPSVKEFQADWNETNSTAYGYIQNKPEIVGQAQSDWTETDASQVSFIKNKPGNTTINTTSGTLVPPTKGISGGNILHADGKWRGLNSTSIFWASGINSGERGKFINVLLKYGTFPRASWSRYTQCFAYLQALPVGASNTWGCQIVKEWIPGKFWHFKGWVIKSIASNSSITEPFFHYGINLDCVVEHTDLTAEQFAIAYNDNRVYSVAKKIDGYQIDSNTDWFGRVNLTDTEIGGVMICTYDANATTGYTGVLRFGGWKYSGTSMVLTDYPLAQQGIGAFEFDIWVNPAS